MRDKSRDGANRVLWGVHCSIRLEKKHVRPQSEMSAAIENKREFDQTQPNSSSNNIRARDGSKPKDKIGQVAELHHLGSALNKTETCETKKKRKKNQGRGRTKRANRAF